MHTDRIDQAAGPQMVRQLLAAWNAQDVDAIASLHSAAFHGQDSAAAGHLHGRADVQAHYRRYLQAFPDLVVTAEALLVAGPHVTLIWHATGTHRGEFLHIPPTLRAVKLNGISVFSVEAGKIVHSMTVWDVAAWLRELGLLPKL